MGSERFPSLLIQAAEHGRRPIRSAHAAAFRGHQEHIRTRRVRGQLFAPLPHSLFERRQALAEEGCVNVVIVVPETERGRARQRHEVDVDASDP